MRALILTLLVLTTVLGLGAATADAAPPPLVGSCSAVTQPCWNGSLACFWFSEELPTCVPVGLN